MDNLVDMWDGIYGGATIHKKKIGGKISIVHLKFQLKVKLNVGLLNMRIFEMDEIGN